MDLAAAARRGTGDMAIKRILRHLLLPRWWAHRVWSAAAGTDVARAIQASEAHHRGELRVVVEGPLPWQALWLGQTARQRALDLFSLWRVWDTEENTGILIYVQLVDRRVEILADRGIASRVPPSAWDALCRKIETAFRDGRGSAGVCAAVAQAGQLLATHFPTGPDNPDELPDAPVLL